MIYSSINYLYSYTFLNEKIKKAFEYYKNHPLKEYDNGSYSIEEGIFVNIEEYETCDKEERFWEAHKKYIDIHLILKGSERIDLNSVINLEEKEYVEEKDFVSLVGEKSTSVELKEKDFLICFPEDAHMTAIKVKENEKVKKAIFKISVK